MQCLQMGLEDATIDILASQLRNQLEPYCFFKHPETQNYNYIDVNCSLLQIIKMDTRYAHL